MKSSESVKRYQRLYIAADELGYYTCNPQLLQLVNKEFHLSKIELLLFWHIASEYDSVVDRLNRDRTPVAKTFEELAEYASCSKNGAAKAISNLIDWEIIKRVNEPKGRGKGQYVPNVEMLHKLLEPLLQLP